MVVGWDGVKVDYKKGQGGRGPRQIMDVDEGDRPID